MGLPFIFYNYPVILLSQDSNSLRPAIFGSIPVETVAYGYYPNDLSTSVRTNVTGTTRGSTSYIAAGTYSAPITLGTSNREYILSGDVTFDGAGLIINASNMTINLNGYTLTYMQNDLESWQTGVVLSSSGGSSGVRPSMTSSGVSNSGLVYYFLNGQESGNWYELYAGSSSNPTLDNTTVSTDYSGQIQSWENGGPASGDLFRVFDPRRTFGIGTLPLVYNISGIEIINGSIIQGDAAPYGRGYNTSYNIGCAPISSIEGISSSMVGGVRMVWSSANTPGIGNRNGGSLTVKYCEIDDQGSFVSNRQRPCGAIAVYSSARIMYNRIVNHRHTCMELQNNSHIIEYNDIYGDSRATNAAAINAFASDNNIFRYNNIYKVGEHPIAIAINDSSQNNNISGNWCECKVTRSSAAYGWNYGAAVSDRWAYNGYRSLANNFYNNTFITYSEDGTGSYSQSRGKTMFFGELMYSSGENVSGNFIGAYNTDNLTECHCIGLSRHNKNVVFRNNILVSSHNHYWIGDNYESGLSGARFIENTLVKAGSDTGYKTFKGNAFYPSNADFISEIYNAGTTNQSSGFGTDAQGFGAMDSDNIYRFGYLLTVTVTQSSVPVSGASVSVFSSGLTLLRNGYLTNSSGQVIVDVPTFYRQGPSFGITSLTPLTVQAISGVNSGSGTISPVSNDSISIAI